MSLRSEGASHTFQGDLKVDPFRGPVDEGETEPETAARETYEESGHVFDLRSALKAIGSSLLIEGIYQIKIEFEEPEYASISNLRKLGDANLKILHELGDRGAKSIKRLHGVSWDERVVYDARQYKPLALFRAQGAQPRLAFQCSRILTGLASSAYSARAGNGYRLDTSRLVTIRLKLVRDEEGLASFVPV